MEVNQQNGRNYAIKAVLFDMGGVLMYYLL